MQYEGLQLSFASPLGVMGGERTKNGGICCGESRSYQLGQERRDDFFLDEARRKARQHRSQALEELELTRIVLRLC